MTLRIRLAASLLPLALAVTLLGQGIWQRDQSPRLPNGKSQHEAILKADYDKALEEAGELHQLTEELKIELEKGDYTVLSVSSLKKTEEIEKLAKKIRSRLKH